MILLSPQIHSFSSLVNTATTKWGVPLKSRGYSLWGLSDAYFLIRHFKRFVVPNHSWMELVVESPFLLAKLSAWRDRDRTQVLQPRVNECGWNSWHDLSLPDSGVVLCSSICNNLHSASLASGWGGDSLRTRGRPFFSLAPCCFVLPDHRVEQCSFVYGAGGAHASSDRAVQFGQGEGRHQNQQVRTSVKADCAAFKVSLQKELRRQLLRLCVRTDGRERPADFPVTRMSLSVGNPIGMPSFRT